MIQSLEESVKREKIKFKPNPNVFKIPPLILVVDLDNTLIYADEERYTSTVTNALPCYYREEMHEFFERLKAFFGEKLLLILWSTGQNIYVLQMAVKLNLHFFDYIFGNKESNESFYKFGARKSPEYLLDKFAIKKWIENQVVYNGGKPPVFAIIDDKAKENTSSRFPYNYTFCPKPFTLKSFHRSKNGDMLSNVESLKKYADILICELIFDQQPSVEIFPVYIQHYFNRDIRSNEYFFQPVSINR